MGYRDEELDLEIKHPMVSAAMERQIGAFFVAWGALESELEVGFHILFRLDPNLASSIYSNLGTQAKIDILSSAIDMLWDALGEQRVKSAHKILARIRLLNDRARNTLAHGQHWIWVDEKTNKSRRAVIRSIARKQLTLVIHPGTPKYWRRMTKAVKTTRAALRRKLCDFHSRFKKFSEEQLWDSTGLQSKVSEPILLRHRKSRPLKRGGFQDHLPIHGKSKPTA